MLLQILSDLEKNQKPIDQNMGKSSHENCKNSLQKAKMQEYSQENHDSEHRVNLIQDKEEQFQCPPFIFLLRGRNRESSFNKAVRKFKEHI